MNDEEKEMSGRSKQDNQSIQNNLNLKLLSNQPHSPTKQNKQSPIFHSKEDPSQAHLVCNQNYLNLKVPSLSAVPEFNHRYTPSWGDSKDTVQKPKSVYSSKEDLQRIYSIQEFSLKEEGEKGGTFSSEIMKKHSMDSPKFQQINDNDNNENNNPLQKFSSPEKNQSQIRDSGQFQSKRNNDREQSYLSNSGVNSIGQKVKTQSFLHRLFVGISQGINLGCFCYFFCFTVTNSMSKKPFSGMLAYVIGSLVNLYYGSSKFVIFVPSFLAIAFMQDLQDQYSMKALNVISAINGIILLIFAKFLTMQRLVFFVPATVLLGYVYGIVFQFSFSYLDLALGFRKFDEVYMFLPRIESILQNISLGSLVSFLLTSAIIAAYLYCQSRRMKIPWIFILVIASTLIGYIFLNQSLRIDIVSQLYKDQSPKLTDLLSYLTSPFLALSSFEFIHIKESLKLACLIYLESLFTLNFSEKECSDTEIDPKQEVFALAFANILSGVFCGIPVSAGIFSTTINGVLIRKSSKYPRLTSLIFTIAMEFLVVFFDLQIPYIVFATVLIGAALFTLQINLFFHANATERNLEVWFQALIGFFIHPVLSAVLGIAYALLQNELNRYTLHNNPLNSSLLPHGPHIHFIQSSPTPNHSQYINATPQRKNRFQQGEGESQANQNDLYHSKSLEMRSSLLRRNARDSNNLFQQRLTAVENQENHFSQTPGSPFHIKPHAHSLSKQESFFCNNHKTSVDIPLQNLTPMMTCEKVGDNQEEEEEEEKEEETVQFGSPKDENENQLEIQLEQKDHQRANDDEEEEQQGYQRSPKRARSQLIEKFNLLNDQVVQLPDMSEAHPNKFKEYIDIRETDEFTSNKLARYNSGSHEFQEYRHLGLESFLRTDSAFLFQTLEGQITSEHIKYLQESIGAKLFLSPEKYRAVVLKFKGITFYDMNSLYSIKALLSFLRSKSLPVLVTGLPEQLAEDLFTLNEDLFKANSIIFELSDPSYQGPIHYHHRYG